MLFGNRYYSENKWILDNLCVFIKKANDLHPEYAYTTLELFGLLGDSLLEGTVIQDDIA